MPVKNFYIDNKVFTLMNLTIKFEIFKRQIVIKY